MIFKQSVAFQGRRKRKCRDLETSVTRSWIHWAIEIIKVSPGVALGNPRWTRCGRVTVENELIADSANLCMPGLPCNPFQFGRRQTCQFLHHLFCQRFPSFARNISPNGDVRHNSCLVSRGQRHFLAVWKGYKQLQKGKSRAWDCLTAPVHEEWIIKGTAEPIRTIVKLPFILMSIQAMWSTAFDKHISQPVLVRTALLFSTHKRRCFHTSKSSDLQYQSFLRKAKWQHKKSLWTCTGQFWRPNI